MSLSLDEIISQYMPSDHSVQEISEFFSVFAQETRIKLISLLSISPLSVGEIGRALRMNQTTVSHQLRILKDRRIVASTRRGKEIVYAIASEGINDILFQAVKVTETRGVSFAEMLPKESVSGGRSF